MSSQVRIHRIQSDPLTLHFSPGYAARAQRLGKLVVEGHRFLAEWLGIEARTTLSILRRESWRRLRRAPYGYPHSVPDKATIFAPAHYPPRLISRLRALYEAAPPSLQQKVGAISCPAGTSHSLDAQIKLFYDLVAIHELGHLFIHHLQLSLGTHWLTELVANLFATAFFVEERPDLACQWFAWAEIQALASVPYRSLAEYEHYYTKLDFVNANYYQGQLNLQAKQIWVQEGRNIAKPLIEQFSLAPKVVTARFKQVAPGFAWG